MKRFCILDSEGKLDNVIVWDEQTEWSPPEGFTLVLEDSEEGQAALAVHMAEQEAAAEARAAEAGQ